MSPSTFDRHYLHVPPLQCEEKSSVTQHIVGGHCSEAELPIFRASLLYIAADLWQLAQNAPGEQRQQLIAVSLVVSSLARS